jgi:hypothetical protein
MVSQRPRKATEVSQAAMETATKAMEATTRFQQRAGPRPVDQPLPDSPTPPLPSWQSQ